MSADIDKPFSVLLLRAVNLSFASLDRVSLQAPAPDIDVFAEKPARAAP